MRPISNSVHRDSLDFIGSVAKKVQLRVGYLPWIVIGGSRDGREVEADR